EGTRPRGHGDDEFTPTSDSCGKDSALTTADRGTQTQIWRSKMGDAFPHVFDPRHRRAAFSAGLSTGPPDRKSAGISGVLEMPVIIGEPSGIRTLRPLIKGQETPS